MNEMTLQVLLEMQENATVQLGNVRDAIKQTTVEASVAGPKTNTAFQGIGPTLLKNRQAFRELAMGVMYLGSTFLGLGVAMSQSNNETIKGVGNTLMMAGAVMTAIGAAAHFVSAIGKMIHALKALRIQQILAQAFSGPAGWAALIGGAAVAGGIMYGVSRMEGAPIRTSTATKSAQTIVIQNIAGSVVTKREIVDDIQQGLIAKQGRESSTGIR